jgi:hypothetical protein
MVRREGASKALRLFRRCLPCVVALTILAAPADAAWQRLDSPNFVVIGDASERELRNVAVKFEAFREVLGRLRGNDVATAPVPTVIIVFRSAKAFSPYTPRYQGRPTDMGGLFVSGQDVNHIAFVNDGSEWSERLIHHEYAHLIIANASGNVPVWLNEGLAELYSTFELSRDGREALIGRPIGDHLALLQSERLLKLSDLLQVDYGSTLYNERDRRSVFYAQAWALTHMITFGEPSRTQQLRAYLQRLAEGAPSLQAWAQAFGADRIDRELERYIDRMLFRAVQHKFTDRLSQFQATAKPLSATDVHAFMGHFLLRQRRLDEAQEQLASAIKLDAANLRAGVLLAHLDIAREDYAAAVQRLLKVGEPLDWLDTYYAGAALSEAIRRNPDTAPEARAAATRYLDAVSRERKFPNAVMRRAAMEIAQDVQPSDETLAAVQRARFAAPGREDYAFVHAQLLALRSDFSAARAVLGPLLSTVHEPRIRESARSLMGWIVTLEKYRAQAAAMAKQDTETPVSPNEVSQSADQSPTPVFRVTKPDEERLEGMLQRIECPAGGSGVFVIQTADAVLRLPAPRMDDVDFVTYRDDFRGSVACGPLKPPMRVYVTSRPPAKPGGPREVVAVEFLPKEMQ